MRKSLIILALLPLFAFADIIATFNNGNIEGVKVVSVGADEIVYKQGKTQKSIPSSEVEGVLYDNGNYVAPPKKAIVAEPIETTSDESRATDNESVNIKSVSSGHSKKQENMNNFEDEKVTKFNVYAFGKNIKVHYITDHTYDGTSVEYRVIYKDQQEEPQWQFLGTSPFAYITPNGGINPLINNDAKGFAEIRPLEIENFKKVKRVEFRLSKEGYETVIVSPLFQVDFTGLYYFISLNKLKKSNGTW